MQPASESGVGAAPAAERRRGGVEVAPAAMAGAAILLLLVLLGWVVSRSGDLFGSPPAPVEQLTVERIELQPGVITAHVLNTGPDPVTISQVTVNEALWAFEASPPELGRLDRGRVRVNYPWIEAEPLALTLISGSGIKFEATVEVPVVTPRPEAGTLLVFALLGAVVGLVPVVLGLLWFPFLRRLGQTPVRVLLALTVGLLVFLGADAFHEAFEQAGELPGVFQGVPLVVGAALLAFLALQAAAGVGGPREGARQRLNLAYRIALGIGLHNLGEGLAIGAAVGLGQAALGTFLVIGFTLHNVTEGFGIVAPILRDRPRLWHFAALGAIGGLPTIAGTWIGGFAPSPLWATLFLAVGAGAIAQVVWEVGRLVLAGSEREASPAAAGWSFAGLAAGIALMYATGLLVKF